MLVTVMAAAAVVREVPQMVLTVSVQIPAALVAREQ